MEVARACCSTEIKELYLFAHIEGGGGIVGKRMVDARPRARESHRRTGECTSILGNSPTGSVCSSEMNYDVNRSTYMIYGARKGGEEGLRNQLLPRVPP